MKRASIAAYATVCLVLTMSFLATSASGVPVSRSEEEKTLQKSLKSIDDDAETPNGAKIVAGRIEEEFGVSDAVVSDLRSKKLGYGDISILLSIASRMPGGVTQENINELVRLRKKSPPLGWGEIARQQGVKVGPVVSEVRKHAAETRRHIEKEGRPEPPANTEKIKRPERPERPERPMRPDRPGKP